MSHNGVSHRGSLFSLAESRQYATMPDNFVFIAFYFVLPKRTCAPQHCYLKLSFILHIVFLNSLLATLNARRSLRLASMGGLVSIPLSKPSASRTSNSGRQDYTNERDDQVSSGSSLTSHCCSRTSKFVEIQIHTSTEVKRDSMSHVSLVCPFRLNEAYLTSWAGPGGTQVIT